MKPFSYVQTFLPDAIESEWHQHPNGNGWVENTALVDKNAFIGESALVFGNAKVYGNAQVYEDARGIH